MLSFSAGKHFAAALLLAGLVGSAKNACPADLYLPFTGGLLGTVVDAQGTPQMGAAVQVFNKYQRFVARAFSAPDGRFAFPDLPADQYSVRVSLDSFLPVSRDKIVIKAGLNSVVDVRLATLFSDIQISYTLPAGAMSDDWKWVLRSSPATRPITRLLDEGPAAAKIRPRVFSGTHAMLSVSGGDGGLIDSDDVASDLGTGFALSTNVFGKNQLQFAGSFGQSGQLGADSLALCAIYTRNTVSAFAAPPEVTLTFAQLGTATPQVGGGGVGGSNGTGGSGQVLRTMSVSFYEVADPLSTLHVEYGATAESVDFVQHANRMSPFARATLDLAGAGSIAAAYADGGRPDELTAHQEYQSLGTDLPNDDLSTALGNLSRLPQISSAKNRLELQRTKNYEAGYRKQQGSRVFALSAFYELVSNGRLNVAGDLSGLDSENVLSDGLLASSTYNMGSYHRSGFVTSLDQHLGQFFAIDLAYGREGGFLLNSAGAPGDSWASNAKFLSGHQANLANVSLRARLPHAGTRISAGYGWLPPGTILPHHAFTTQSVNMAPGLNLYLRQPFPTFLGMPGHFEFTADLRNLLAQGYVPMNLADGRTLLIVEAPRAIRGGLSFIF